MAYALGQLYLQGIGVPKDVELGKSWLLIAIMKGKTEAKTYLEEYEKKRKKNGENQSE